MSEPQPAASARPGVGGEDMPDEWVVHHPVPAWLLSVVLHAAVLLTLGLTLKMAPRGADVEPDRSGGIALVQRNEGRREYLLSDGDQSTAPRLAPQKAAATAMPSAEEFPVNLAGVLPSTGAPLGTSDVGGALPDADDLTVGAGPSRQFGGDVRTQVFGVSGQGRKFVYVFDRSGSMGGHGGRPLRASKRELIASLQDLSRTHQFQIVFYNTNPQVFNPTGGTPRLMWGDQRSKALAERFIRGIVPDGGTRHMEALTLAVRMRPDVIFFLTDAEEPQMSEDDLARIRRLNGAHQTAINTIQFGFGPFDGEENFLTRLARQNGGQSVYQDVSALPE